MKEVAVYEAKTRLSELLAAVEKGEQVVITRRGVAVARLVGAGPVDEPAAHAARRRRIAAVFAALRKRRETTALGGSLREAIESGRD